MSAPSELSFDEILKFMLAHNGKVTNFELVKHFKPFLTDPDKKDEARSIFKKHVNTLASIKTQNDEKWLVLKRKYCVNKDESVEEMGSIETSTKLGDESVSSELSLNASQPPPYIPPPSVENNNTGESPVLDVTENTKDLHHENVEQSLRPVSQTSLDIEITHPVVHSRKKSNADKVERKSISVPKPGLKSSLSCHDDIQNMKENLPLTRSEGNIISDNCETEQTMSVKERKQMFNRMASEGDATALRPLRKNIHGVDEEDRTSVISSDHKGEIESLDPKQKEWVLRGARGEYHSLAKMCSENPHLIKFKDPFTGYTAMHWACKRGDENLVKLFAGIDRGIVNVRSNGGYTPLHIAMQFRHENVCKLLIEVYDANTDTRDWSGRKPRQYFVSNDTALSPDAYRKFKLKADKKNADKEGFLRIGSINVRVKKTTEAFSNFLGVGASRASAYVPKLPKVESRLRRDDDHLHKSWGSADSIPKDDKAMPPPTSSKVRRRGVSGRQGVGAHSRSTPSTPDQPRHLTMGEESNGGDSDSDSAAGFHAAWRSHRSSHS